MWNKFVSKTNQFTKDITSLFMIIIVVILFVQIISRQIFGTSFAWTADLARYLCIWVVFLGASVAIQYGSHIRIDVLVDKLQYKHKKLLELFIVLISLIFLVVLIFNSFELIINTMDQTSQSLHIPMGLIYTIFPLSGVLQIINIIDVTIRFWKSGEKVEGGI